MHIVKIRTKITFTVLIVILGISLLSNIVQFKKNQRAKSELMNSELNRAFNLLNMSSESINHDNKLASMRLAGAASMFYSLQTPLAQAGVNHTTDIAVALNAADMEIAFPATHSPQEVRSMKDFVKAAARDGRKMLQPHLSTTTIKTVMNQIYNDIPQKHKS